MKYLILIMLSVVTSTMVAQQIQVILVPDPITKKYVTSGVIPVNSKPSEVIMKGAYKWLSEIKYAATLASKGIILDEAVFGKITVNQYFISTPKTSNSKVRFSLTLEFRDGRFKYHFTDFYYLAVTSRKEFESVTTTEEKLLVMQLLRESNAYINSFLSEITEYINNYNEDSNW
jgi:hypothetical protein